MYVLMGGRYYGSPQNEVKQGSPICFPRPGNSPFPRANVASRPAVCRKVQDGHHLTELLAHHRYYRAPYLAWVAERGFAPEEALSHYRRALVAWYEARMHADHPYRGEVFDFLTALATVYYGVQPERQPVPLGDDPLGYLPRPAPLDAAGQQLLQQFRALPAADRDLLLLADYHQLTPTALLRATDQPDEYALRDRLTELRHAAGNTTPATDLVWTNVITVAGRQDLLQTLERAATPPPEPVPILRPRPEVSVVRKPRSWTLPRPGILVAGVLFGVLLYLLYDTFGEQTVADRAQTYFTPYPNIFADRPPETEEERDLQRILVDYDRGDYRTAYTELLPTADAYPAAPLYLGVSALALDDPARAREWFARLPADSPYRDAGEWYAALATVQQGGAAGGSALLEAIANDTTHPYRERAQQLLSDL